MKTLEQAATEKSWSLTMDRLQELKLSATIFYDQFQPLSKKSFIAGANWREQQAASGFEEWWADFVRKDLGPEMKAVPDSKIKKAWQAAQLSSAKLLAEKDSEIAELKKKTGFKTGFYIRECNNCGHDWSRED